MQTQQGAGDVTRALAEGIGTQYGVAQQADVDERIRLADAATKAADAAAATGSIITPDAVSSVAAVGPPTEPGTRDYQLKRGSDGKQYRWIGRKWKLAS
jgi:hypothetical protein